MTQAGLLNISQVATRLSLSLRTIRFYEELNLIRPKRVGVSRYFSEHDCTRIAAIVKGRQLGLTLAQIRALIDKGGQSNQEEDIIMLMPRELLISQLKVLEARRIKIETAIDELLAARKKS